MQGFRKEKDSLGFVEVPEGAYYGAQTVRARRELSHLRDAGAPAAHPRTRHGEARCG